HSDTRSHLSSSITPTSLCLSTPVLRPTSLLFFSNHPPPTEIYTLSLHDALPIYWGLRKSRNATSLNSRFKSLDTLKVKIISVTFRRVIRTNHKKASKIWRHENIQLGGCQS